MSKLIKKEDAIKAMAKAVGRIFYDAEEISRHVMNSIPTIEPNLILPERMERGECYEVGETIVVLNHDDYYDLLCRAMENEPKQGEWMPCSERLPETDNTNKINEFDVLLAVRPKKHPERTPQVYIGKLRPVEGDDGSGNFWGIKTAPCEWTIWGWSYFQEPEVLAWMPLPKPWKGADDGNK